MSRTFVERGVTALVLIGSLAGMGCGLAHLKDTDYFTAGKRALSDQRYAEALGLFDKVPTTDPNYQNARFYAGKTTAIMGDGAKGLKLMLAARAVDAGAFDRSTSSHDLGDLYTIQMRQWSVELADSARGLFDAGPVVVAITSGGVLAAISKTTHRVLWEHAIGRRPAPFAVFGHGKAFVIRESKSAGNKLIVEALDLADGRVAWTHDLGFSHRLSTVSLRGSTVFVGEGEGERKPGAIVALSASSGQPLWRVAVDGIPGPTAVDDRHVCTQTTTNHAVCVELSSRKIVLAHELAERAEPGIVQISRGRVLLTLRGALYALKVGAQPSLAWKTPLRGQSSAPLVSSDGSQVLVQGATALQSYAADTGQLVWEAPVPHHAGATGGLASSPRQAGDAALGWTNRWVFAAGLADGKRLWAAHFGGKQVSAAPIAGDDGMIYVAAGNKIHCIKPADWNALVDGGDRSALRAEQSL